MNEEEEDDEDSEEDDLEAKEAEAEVEVQDLETGTTKVVKTRKKGTKGKRWRTIEDEYLCDAWKLVTNDSKVGANQTFGRYWKRIHDQFHETEKFGE